MAQSFEMRTDPDGVLWLSGEVDLAVVDRVLAAGDDLRARHELLIDLSEVTFIDSSGIRAIVELCRRVRCPTVLRNPSQSARRVLELVGLEGHGGIRIES
jgi:anti-anti-sigma factor